jgi:hypothetical protein
MSDSSFSDTPPRPERKATLRLGQRELSLISLGVIIFSVVIVAFFGYRIYLNFKITRDLIVAENNLRALYTAMRGYAQDWEGNLPAAEKWVDQTAGYLSAPPNSPGGPLAYLQGPADSGSVGYVFNDLASGYNVETNKSAKGEVINPARLVLLIERPGVSREENNHVSIPVQGNRPGEQALLKELAFPHNSDDTEKATAVVLYANGKIQRVMRIDLK